MQWDPGTGRRRALVPDPASLHRVTISGVRYRDVKEKPSALEEAKAGKNDEFKAQIKELVTLTDEMNSKQADSKLDVAYETLVKIRDEPDPAAATKMLEDFIPTLVDW